MGRDKDLIIQEYEGSRKAPLVTLPSQLAHEMYNEIKKLSKQMKAIKQILEVSNEK